MKIQSQYNYTYVKDPLNKKPLDYLVQVSGDMDLNI